MEPDETIDGLDDVDDVDVDEPRQPSHRSWLFSGSPPSSWTVGALAFVYAAAVSWWSEPGLRFDFLEPWKASRSLTVAIAGAIAAGVAAVLYLMLRVALPQTKPRVTKRWRSEPLVLRTASLAQSIIFFRTLQALPALMTGFALGMLLTAAAGAVGVNSKVESGALAIQAGCLLLGSLVAQRANRDAERSNYAPLVKLPW